MKIKVTQLDEKRRSTIALAIEYYIGMCGEFAGDCRDEYVEIAHTIRHGELLTCEYQYNQGEDK